MNKAWLFLILKILSDILMVNLSFIFGYMINFGTVNISHTHILIYSKVLVFISLLWMIIFNLAGLYKLQTDKINRIDGIFSVAFGVFSSAFFTYVIVVFLYREAFYSKGIVIYASIIAFFLVILSRQAIWWLFCKNK